MTQKPSSNPPAQNIDIILNVIGESLQLTQTQRKNIETSYKSVGEWLEQEDTFFNQFKPETFPHGSFLLGTTLKPYGRENEFDLDFIVFLEDMFYEDYNNPKKVLDELEKRMKEHGTYKDMIERKNRCIRINYTNKNSTENEYHMDMQPACPDQYIRDNKNSDDYLRVPDRKQNNWMFSSPKVYANWFEDKCNKVAKQALENRASNLSEYFQFEIGKAKAQAPLPATVSFKYQKPLNRAVQLIKRCRDIYFAEEGDNEYRTSSIILTTLAGGFYEGSVSEYEIISLFLKKTLAKLQKEGENFKVLNPVHSKENFTEKWQTKPQYRQSFEEFIIYFKGVWEEIPKAIKFIDKENVSSQKQLVKSFGEKATNKALNEIRETYKLQTLLSSSKLINEANAYTDKEGKITNNSNNTKNEPHQFYGE